MGRLFQKIFQGNSITRMKTIGGKNKVGCVEVNFISIENTNLSLTMNYFGWKKSDV